MPKIVSSCIYCAEGCKLEYEIENDKIIKVSPVKDDPVSLGRPCIKGLTINEVVDQDRILYPMIRQKNELKRVSWDEALNLLTEKIKEFLPNEIFFSPSGYITNEDNYAMQKFVRLILKSNNVDGCCTRLCHIATVLAFRDTLGIGATPDYYNDILNLDCLLVIGSNPASNHPVDFNRILQMKAKGGKLIVVSPIVSESAEKADLHLPINPGTESAFFNALINIIVQNNWHEKEAENLPGFAKLKEISAKYPPEVAEKICGLKKELIEQTAEFIGKSKNFGLMHGMGLTQHVNGLENVHLLVDLALIKNAKIVTSRGEINVQGCGDVLTGPNLLTFSDQVNQENFKKIWGGDLPHNRGLNLMEAIGLSQAKMIWISNFNPAQSMPDLNRIHKNLKNAFLVQMDSYFNLTSEFADIILPVPILIEREGTITNGERRIRKVAPVRQPLGESQTEKEIFALLAEKLGFKNIISKDPKTNLQEIKQIIKDYEKINIEALWNGEDQFADKKIKFKKLVPEDFEGVEEIKNKKYPFILFTYRSPFLYLTHGHSEKSPTLKKAFGEAVFFINQQDALSLNIKDGDKIEVTSKTANLVAPIKISSRILPGYIGATFHSRELLINKLFPLQFDEETFTPNFKIVAVNIKKI